MRLPGVVEFVTHEMIFEYLINGYSNRLLFSGTPISQYDTLCYSMHSVWLRSLLFE